MQKLCGRHILQAQIRHTGERQNEITKGCKAPRFIGPEADRVTIRELAEDFENDYRVNGK